jgi:hypothetical protein
LETGLLVQVIHLGMRGIGTHYIHCVDWLDNETLQTRIIPFAPPHVRTGKIVPVSDLPNETAQPTGESEANNTPLILQWDVKSND